VLCAGAVLGTCIAAAAEPIRLHPENPHYFLFRGRPTVLITSGEHYGAVINRAFDQRKYLDALAADRLNYTRIFTGSYVESAAAFGIKRNTLAPEGDSFLAPWARSGEPGNRKGGNKFDLGRWNPGYFARLKAFVIEAGKRGIVVEVTLFSSHYDDGAWDASPFHPSNNVNDTNPIDRRKLHTLDNGNILAHQERLVRALVRELNEFDNITFEIQNEPWSDRTAVAGSVNPYLNEQQRGKWPNSIDVADAESVAWQARVAAWITDEESRLPNRHLIAQNYCNFGYPVPELVPGVSILNFHYAFPEAAMRNFGKNIVIGYDETGFLGQSDTVYRKQAWNFMLAGGGLFNGLDYSFTIGREDGTDTEPNGPGGGSPAFRKQLGILAGFLNAFDLVRARPDTTVVRNAPGAYTKALSVPGRDYGVYIAAAKPAPIEVELPPASYAVQWIDTKTGAISGKSDFTHTGGPRTLQPPPFEDDIALRIRVVGR
jgi:hypothetical protein